MLLLVKVDTKRADDATNKFSETTVEVQVVFSEYESTGQRLVA